MPARLTKVTHGWAGYFRHAVAKHTLQFRCSADLPRRACARLGPHRSSSIRVAPHAATL
ncbi:group II intron maturase-specific domain-containing protein [Actinoplanes sp. NPDC026670]|uniref:group II intron maturase-specific domain-containing protein n=1 Tax=Actinoplanes sp. NPDC026670 TaxID=3154700 RepID=UPI0033E2D35F